MSDEYIVEFGNQKGTFDTEEEAMDFVMERYPDAVFCDDWDNAGPHRIRRLFWETEEDSKGSSGLGDDGYMATGEISRIKLGGWENNVSIK